MTKQKNPTNILLIEDNEGDILLTKEAFEEAFENIQIYVARDGEEGLDFLYKRGNYQDAPTPHLVFLDLNMPRKGGKEVLKDVKSNDDLKTIPIIMLTTSNDPSDVRDCYALNVNCYINKPVDYDQFINVVSLVKTFWFNTVNLPK